LFLNCPHAPPHHRFPFHSFSQYDEIANKLGEYLELVGSEQATLLVTGHSLGAALATIFSLYASTEDRFTKNDAIETVTFGAP